MNWLPTSINIGVTLMRREKWFQSVAVAVPLACAAQIANALPVTFSSNGSFANPTNCSGVSSPACTVQNSGNTLVLGGGEFEFNPPTFRGPESTLAAVDFGPVKPRECGGFIG